MLVQRVDVDGYIAFAIVLWVFGYFWSRSAKNFPDLVIPVPQIVYLLTSMPFGRGTSSTYPGGLGLQIAAFLMLLYLVIPIKGSLIFNYIGTGYFPLVGMLGSLTIATLIIVFMKNRNRGNQ